MQMNDRGQKKLTHKVTAINQTKLLVFTTISTLGLITA
jgi:hypothetical protein